MNKFIKNNPLVFWLSIIFTLFALLIYYPSVRLNFLLIDDGQIVKNSRQIVRSVKTMNLENLKPILFEANEGRVRPLYWISQTVLTMLSFDNPSLMHVARVLILILTLVLIIKTMIRLKIDSRWIFFGAFLFVFNFQNFENYYRLGPTEVYLGLYFASFIYFILKKRITTFDYILVALISLFANFTKETFFLITIPYVLFLLPNKVAEIKTKRKFFLYLITVNLITAALVFAIKFGYGEQVGYSQNYKFTLTAILDHFVNYFKQISFYQSPIISIIVLYAIYWMYINVKNIFSLNKLNDLLFVFFMVQCCLSLAILLPWQFVLGRYLININISLVFLVAIALNSMIPVLLKVLKQNSINNDRIINVLLLVCLPTIFVRNLFAITNFQEWQKTDNELTTDLIKSLSKNIPTNEIVFVNYIKGDANIEIYLETKWHLGEFHGRDDVNFSYLDSTNLCSNGNDRYILDRTAERYIPKNALVANRFKSLDSGNYSYDPLNYGQVLKSFIGLEKYTGWQDSYKFDWTIYKQPANTCIKIQ